MSPPDDGPLLAVDAEKGGKRQATTGVERVAARRVSPYAIDNCGDVECAKYRQHVLVGEPA